MTYLKQNYDTVLIIDAECSCWRTNDEQPNNEFSEIIEIGITEVDTKNLKILRNKSIIIRPQNSKISKFCTELTSLTQEQVDKGVSLYQACEELKLRFKSDKRLWMSWGDYDRKQFNRNCKDYQISYPFSSLYMDVHALFSLIYSEDLSMEDALKYLNLPLIGVPHRGDSDSRNVAEILIHLLKTFRALG
jgi:inhibitor of KinA sporulation pathway (predicted exonuclease)